MGSKLFSLEQRVAYTLLERLESREMSWDRATEISKQILQIIPEKADDSLLPSIIGQLRGISELRGLEFGLEGANA